MNSLTRKLNALAVIGIGLILVGGFGVQWIYHERPCPLCFVQRMGMLGVMAAGLMNLRFGIQAFHYGLGLLGALVGAGVSARHILLHIAPGSKVFGPSILGLSLYTWAFLVFVSCILGIAFFLMLPLSKDPEKSWVQLSVLEKTAFLLSVGLILGNIGVSFYYCGLGFCL